MATLKNVQMGWKGLQDVINRIIDTVNSQSPVEGSGIRIVDTDNGKLISVAGETTGQGSGGGAQTQQGDPHELVNGLIWRTVKWQEVTVVDPSTCAQSTLTVLVSTGDVNDSIVINFTDTLLWATPAP